jgi:hypothetical protein
MGPPGDHHYHAVRAQLPRAGKLCTDLSEALDTFGFCDENSGFYGLKDLKVLTAVCAEPTDRAVVDPIIGHLERYKEIHRL